MYPRKSAIRIFAPDFRILDPERVEPLRDESENEE